MWSNGSSLSLLSFSLSYSLYLSFSLNLSLSLSLKGFILLSQELIHLFRAVHQQISKWRMTSWFRIYSDNNESYCQIMPWFKYNYLSLIPYRKDRAGLTKHPGWKSLSIKWLGFYVKMDWTNTLADLDGQSIGLFG